MLTRETYSVVKQGHVVPVVFQRSFAIDNKIALHVDGRETCVPAKIQNTATRGPFYRRTRPDGTEIDDVEASLSHIEEAAGPVLRDLSAGQPLTRERKFVLAQFYGIQMVRGPAFFERRSELVQQLLDELDEDVVRPTALRAAGGDLDALRAQLRDAELHPTQQLTRMLAISYKLSSVIGVMRWQLLSFAEPLLAYSDQPVVVWPAATASGRGRAPTRGGAERVRRQPGGPAVDAPTRLRAAARTRRLRAVVARL